MRSLEPLAADADVAALALERLKQPVGEEEEYLAWVELCVHAVEWDTLELTLPVYATMSEPVGRRTLLFSWSGLLGFRGDFYRYLSYDRADDRASVLDEARASSMDNLKRNKIVSEIRHTLKQEAKHHGNDAVGYFLAMEKALFHALKPWNSSVRAVIAHFLHHPVLTEEEEVFLLMTIRKLIE